jgi:hypothetical protein
MMTAKFEIPDFDAMLGGLVGSVSAEKAPLLIALLERVAAGRYRQWAAAPECRAQETELLACAGREEQIADRIEALYPDARLLQKDIMEELPQLASVEEDLFGGRSIRHQFAILAAGERSGAGVWERLAESATSERARETMKSCVALEHANADALEALLRD